MLQVKFNSGRNDSIITRIDGKIAFAERKGPQPHPGETWEVEIAGQGKCVLFLRLIRLIERQYYLVTDLIDDFQLFLDEQKVSYTRIKGQDTLAESFIIPRDNKYVVVKVTAKGRQSLPGFDITLCPDLSRATEASNKALVQGTWVNQQKLFPRDMRELFNFVDTEENFGFYE